MFESEELKEAWKQGIRMLTRREYSAYEIAQKLSSKGHNEDDIVQVLTQLRSDGYQSDKRFSEHYIRHRNGRGIGPNRIRLELNEKGVESSVISQSIEQAEIDWYERAEQVRAKKFKGEVAQSWEEKGKQKQFLDYRGFTQDQIESCVD